MKKGSGQNIQLRVGLVLLATILTLMVFLWVFYDADIHIRMDNRLEPPSGRFLLGTDELGRDLLSCIVQGAWISLLIGLIVVLLSFSLGCTLGLVSGLSGGIVDIVVMRVVDIFLAFPGILLALALVSFFNRGIFTLIWALTLPSWGGYARLVRGEVLKFKQGEFILAARSYNASFLRILFHHLLPLIFPLAVAQASLGISGVILAESSLNFLGVGLRPEVPSLGQLIDSGRAYMFERPEFILAPGMVLFLLIISFNLIGEGLRKHFTR